ncbi:MAG: S-layer homology domain-containing protein [Ruminococcaceae bacterium]|nr:S-layer homology domain-containing protein [Oscillospiraceae bacterium]
MKNIFTNAISIMLVLLMLTGMMSFSVLAADFADLNGHWGYDFVMTLVNDGTVNGYPDGTFRPDGTVTRAEFVKLIGKSDVLYEGTYTDIADHWGYDFIMYSGLDGYEDGTFKPDTPITRNDCVNLIWKRNGSIKDTVCPSVITNQGTNPDAVAWAYTNGIVCGDDGLNLRLSDTLTRAEAATLIVRSRSIDPNAAKVRFIDRVNPEILKAVFESFNIFGDIVYNPDATITNGQLARAVISYGEMTSEPEYGDIETPYSGIYAKDMMAVAKECMGDVPLNAESENAPASIKHALSEFMYHTLQRTGRLKPGNGTPYTDYNDYTGNVGLFMKYAYLNGIMFDYTGNIYPDNQITHKQLAAILLQIDELFGTQVAYKDEDKMFVKINKNLSTYSANYKEYRCILADVSQKAYAEFKPEASVLDYTDEAHSSASIIADTLNILKGKYGTDDYKLSFMSYPTLACEKGISITFVAKLTANVPDGTKVSAIFPDIFYSSRDADASNGDVYLVFKTTEPMIKFYFEPEELQLVDVIQ